MTLLCLAVIALAFMWLADKHARLLRDMNADIVAAFKEIAALKDQQGL